MRVYAVSVCVWVHAEFCGGVNAVCVWGGVCVCRVVFGFWVVCARRDLCVGGGGVHTVFVCFVWGCERRVWCVGGVCVCVYGVSVCVCVHARRVLWGCECRVCVGGCVCAVWFLGGVCVHAVICVWGVGVCTPCFVWGCERRVRVWCVGGVCVCVCV